MEFDEIYTAYFNDVYLYIRRLSGNEHIAEEITSDCFFKAMNSIDSFRGDCDIRIWLCQIAKNCYYTYMRKQGRAESIDDLLVSEIPDSSLSIEEQAARKDEAHRIRKKLHEIEAPYKEVFMWRVFADLSFRQIGQMFGKTENWACVTYHRARIMIQKGLEDDSND